DRLNYYFSAPNSIGELEFSEISIYPNPTEDIIIFKKNQGAVAFQIYDQSGRLVMKGKNLDGSLNIEKLAPGTYTLLVQQASLSYSAQIQKQ
ncbi:MAG: T9SS type A sorting domain-containing protein, partial [Luteibaculum sp.]